LNEFVVSHLVITPTIFPKVLTVVDSTLANASKPFAIHASSSTSTNFLTGQEIVSYLQSLESEDKKLEIVDFAELKASSSVGTSTTPVASKTAQLDKKRKEVSKIEGAVEIAIGVKKEVDFAEWYTNVLLKSGMLEYYSVSGCYILRPWSFSIWEQIQSKFKSFHRAKNLIKVADYRMVRRKDQRDRC
jgi:prolyl-tRNA synthetase